MKTISNKVITAQQLKALHATFRRIGMDDDARPRMYLRVHCRADAEQ